MTRQSIWLGALCALMCAGVSAQGPTDLVNRIVTAHVVSVADGDTIDVIIPPNRRVKVRLHGVDTPERGEPFSQQATRFTRVLVFDRDVKLSGKDVDVYGRLVARIVVAGTDASEAIIAAGLGCTFREFVSDERLQAAYDEAKTHKRGFWASGARAPRCVEREASEKTSSSASPSSELPLVGNTSSKVYHLQSCRNASCRYCTRTFLNSAEAEAAGFRPAGDCIGR